MTARETLMEQRGQDPRVDSMRWVQVNRFPKAHLWLGRTSGCGVPRGEDVWLLDMSAPAARCANCLAYAQGWLDAFDHGQPAWNDLGKPQPIAGTRLERAS